MAASKKAYERWALDRFLALLKGPTPETIEPTEEPDFALTFSSTRVGVELTDLYWKHTSAGRPRQEQESLRRRVVKTAEHVYADRGGPPVQVSVHFDSRFVLGKAAVSPLATSIADWAAARLPSGGGSFQEEANWLNRDSFPEGLHALAIYRYDWMSRPRFSAPDADYIPELTVADVQRTLASKEVRYSSYLASCGEVWLVMNVNVGRLSTAFEIGNPVAESAYETSFSRVFLVEHMASQLFELNRVHGLRRDGSVGTVERR